MTMKGRPLTWNHIMGGALAEKKQECWLLSFCLQVLSFLLSPPTSLPGHSPRLFPPSFCLFCRRYRLR